VLDAKTALATAETLYTQLTTRRQAIEKAERYHRGDQPLAFASDEWKTFHRARYVGFSDNWCGVVGSAPSERMKITGFRIGDDTDPLSDDERALWHDWELNDGSIQSSQGILTSTIAKRSFAMVWGNRDDEPMLSWEHPSQVIVSHDPETREKRFGVKAWADDDREFLTLYEPDAVWKWERKIIGGLPTTGRTESGIYVSVSASSFGGGGWTVRQGTGDDTWPIKNPLGRVPIAEFPNRPPLKGEPISDIEGTMAMQDAINLLWAYLFTAADHASMPARVVMGQGPPKIPVLDAQGKQIGEKAIENEALTKGRMLWLTGQSTTISQWDAAKLDIFTNVINIAVRHIAAQTRTPIYLIHGELGNVNGETLTGLDAPLVSKVSEAKPFHAAGLRDVFAMMALVRGNKSVAEAARVGQVGWSKPFVQSESIIADAAIKSKQVGLPLQTILEDLYGYSQKRIDQIMEQVREESQDPYLAAIGAKDQAAMPAKPAMQAMQGKPAMPASDQAPDTVQE